MKLKAEYLDSKIRFMGQDHIVRFINPVLYTKMYDNGFAFMFETKEKTNDKGIKPNSK